MRLKTPVHITGRQTGYGGEWITSTCNFRVSNKFNSQTSNDHAHGDVDKLYENKIVFSKCAIAGLGIDNVQWLKSVRPSDALVCRFEILETRRSASRPGEGVAIILYNITNQRNEVVMKMRTAGLLKCRETRATSASRDADD